MGGVQRVLAILIHSMLHVTTGLQPTPTFYLGCTMKIPCKSHMALRLVLWYVFTSMKNDFMLRIISHTPHTSQEETYSNSSRLICCTSWSKVFSKTTLLSGWVSILSVCMVLWVGPGLSTRLTTGKQHDFWSQCCVSPPWDRIVLVPPFPGLRRFKQGCKFTQWTGDDSKALMKVC